MLYDGNIFLRLVNAFHRQINALSKKRSIGKHLKETPRIHSCSSSLGIDSVHMMATANIKWGPDIVYL